MKYLLFILFSAVTLAQTYDVGQNNASTATALANALSYPDSNYLKTSELGSVVQSYDGDLNTIAGLTATTNNFILSVGSAWASQTPTQVKVVLSLGNVTNESKATMFTSPTFTGTVTIPTPFTLGAVSVLPTGTELNFVDGVTSPLQPQIDAKQSTAGMSAYFDTLAFNINIPDTVITGDNAIWKIPNNITITEVAAFTNTGTVTFNIEERGETTPNTAGTDVMTSDLVADTDQQETGTFSNAALERNDWMALSVTSKTGDPTLFGVSIRYIKTN